MFILSIANVRTDLTLVVEFFFPKIKEYRLDLINMRIQYVVLTYRTRYIYQAIHSFKKNKLYTHFLHEKVDLIFTVLLCR